MSHHSLDWVHPLLKEWFISHIGEPTQPQLEGWPSILEKNHTLISAPTGSGKTLAAFLPSLNGLVSQSLTGELHDTIEVVYVSPLKALSNDIHKNLIKPLTEISDFACQKELKMQEIRVAVRTGDTQVKDRQLMLKKPPHILVTTPESLYILLTAAKSRALFTNVKTIIIDEIHALANNKRGSHLALTIERLCVLNEKTPVRIGLSATQKPLDIVANFLTGNSETPPKIVEIGYVRPLELKIEVPTTQLGSITSHEMWDEIYKKIAEFAQGYRTLLIFVNTRRLAERIAHRLGEHLGEDNVLAHHGSLSRKLRLEAETKLKNGELKALVATASLELGIDIGSVDVVCQIGSPRAISIALQRVGRSGHWHGATSRGIFFATTRDELIECAALIHAIKQKDLDKLIIPHEPLDILAQQLIAICATSEWQEDELFSLVKKAYPYKNLTRETFNSIIQLLSEGISASRGRYATHLFRDQVNGLVKARRGARLTAIMNGGAIPENGLFSVIAEPMEAMIGTLDEDFAVESNRGDIFLLGTTSWKINRIEGSTARVIVEDAHGAPPSVPFWRGEAPGRTNELSSYVSKLREKLEELIHDHKTCITWLNEHTTINEETAQQIIDYCQQGKDILGAIPSQNTIIAERFFDEAGGMQLVIHAPFGARINKAWGLALRKRFCRSFNFELQAAATDDGLVISLTEQHSFPLADVFHFLHQNTLQEVLIQAVLQSPLFNTRWRAVATRSLALSRFRGGKKIAPHILRILSDDLLAAVFPDAAACQDNLAGEDIKLPQHPFIDEVMKDCLNDALDLEGLLHVINNIYQKKITLIAVDTPVPSVFAHELLGANPYAFLDDAPLEERRTRAVELRRILPESVLKEAGKLDPIAISEVQQLAWPDVRNKDELHDFLQTVIALPENKLSPSWKLFIDDLISHGRIGIALHQDQKFYYAAEKTKTFKTIYPDAAYEIQTKEIENSVDERDALIICMLRGWLLHLGPTKEEELSHLLHLTINEVKQGVYALESTGLILRGHFRTTFKDTIEWCERRLLARIHYLTLEKLRKEIEPVDREQLMQWLLKWQHLLPGTQLKGEQGLLEIIQQLQGFEIPANAWETQIFAKRVKDYDPGMIDNLCFKGIVCWGRISSPGKKRITPTSTSLVTFFLRENVEALVRPSAENEAIIDVLSHHAKVIYLFLKTHGASFFVDIVSRVNLLKSEVETGLWELVAAGLVSGDGFDNLRSLIDKGRRSGKVRSRYRVKTYSSGRWSLLINGETLNSLQRIQTICWILLKRYGVVFRDLLDREKNLPSWRELLITFRRLEEQGEIRGGRFVAGFSGEQFALPYAVESLRATRKIDNLTTPSLTLSSVDPLNLNGILIKGERIPAISGKFCHLFQSSDSNNLSTRLS